MVLIRTRISVIFYIILAIILILVSTTLALFVEFDSWAESLNLVYVAIFNPKALDMFELSLISQIFIFILVLASTALQLGIFIIAIFTLGRWLIAKNEMITTDFYSFFEVYQVRRLLTIFFAFSTFISVILIKTIEQFTWLDTFYFMVITMSTVGFMDITRYNISKIFTIILIFNGIALIGLLSQLLINRIVNLQLTKQYSLPNQALELENHVIIAGYGSKGRRLAQLFNERRYTVVIVESNENRAKLAEANGYLYVINGDITKPALLDILSLDKSGGLFLLLSDDNLVIQSGIIARSIAPDLDIYGEFLKKATYDIARYAGINKPISLFGFLTNELQYHFTTEEVKVLLSKRDLKQQESTLSFIQIPIDFDHQGYFSNPLIIGEISDGLNEIYLEKNLSIDYDLPPLYTSHLLIGFDKTELEEVTRQIKSDRSEMKIKRLIFAGYSDLVISLIERLEFPTEKIIVLWQKLESEEELVSKNIANRQWTLETGHTILEELISEGDMVISSFDDITSSLIVGVTLKNLGIGSLIQLVPYEYDIEPLMKVGADVVLTPQHIISKAILGIFMKEINISPSLIFTNGHLFEHLVTPDEYYVNKIIDSLLEERINVLYIMEEGESKFTRSDPTYKVKSGDRLVIFIKNERKEQIDIKKIAP